MIKRWIVLSVFLMALAFTPQLMAQGCSVSGISLASTGALSSACYVPPGQSISYSITGTWAGTVNVYYSENGGASYLPFTSGLTSNQAAVIPPATANRLYVVKFDSRTSGTVTGNLLGLSPVPGRNIYTTVPIGDVAYSSLGTGAVATVAGTWYISDVDIPRPMTVTTIGNLNGGTVGTDKLIYALFDGSGRPLGNTAVAGTVTAGSNSFQEIALTTNVSIPAGHYYIGVQSNGTTDKQRWQTTSTFIHTMTTSTTGAFGTVPFISPPTTFTTSTGPIAYVKGF